MARRARLGAPRVLEDTELAFLLMIANLQGEDTADEHRIRSDIRLLHYGIGRDAYEAHILLSKVGLVAVTVSPDRHPDGKVQN